MQVGTFGNKEYNNVCWDPSIHKSTIVAVQFLYNPMIVGTYLLFISSMIDHMVCVFPRGFDFYHVTLSA